jgi:hypothetical protein
MFISFVCHFSLHSYRFLGDFPLKDFHAARQLKLQQELEVGTHTLSRWENWMKCVIWGCVKSIQKLWKNHILGGWTSINPGAPGYPFQYFNTHNVAIGIGWNGVDVVWESFLRCSAVKLWGFQVRVWKYSTYHSKHKRAGWVWIWHTWPITLQTHGSEMQWFWISNSDLCLLQSQPCGPDLFAWIRMVFSPRPVRFAPSVIAFFSPNRHGQIIHRGKNTQRWSDNNGVNMQWHE